MTARFSPHPAPHTPNTAPKNSHKSHGKRILAVTPAESGCYSGYHPLTCTNQTASLQDPIREKIYITGGASIPRYPSARTISRRATAAVARNTARRFGSCSVRMWCRW